jgi:hypothetical protein
MTEKTIKRLKELDVCLKEAGFALMTTSLSPNTTAGNAIYVRTDGDERVEIGVSLQTLTRVE